MNNIEDIEENLISGKELVTSDNGEHSQLVETETFDEEIDNAEKNQKDIIDMGMQSLRNMKKMVETSESSKNYQAFQEVATLMYELNQKFIDQRIIKDESKHPEEKSVTNNNLFFGTPQDLLNRINKSDG